MMILHEFVLLILSATACVIIASVPDVARWVRACIIIPLLSIAVHRADALTTYYFGLDFIPSGSSYLLLYIVLIAMIVMFIMEWRRRKEIAQIEAMREARREQLRQREAQLEAIRERNEELISMNWDFN